MEQMETQTEALDRLAREGYTANYELTDDGRIAREGTSWAADELTIEALLRFEGISDPGDEAMLLALDAPDGQKGTMSLPYGPDMTADQVTATQALLVSHRDRSVELNAPDPMLDRDGPKDPRMNEVVGDEGMPGEFLDTPNNEPGDQSPPAG